MTIWVQWENCLLGLYDWEVAGDWRRSTCPGSGGLAGAVYLKTAATHPGVCKRLMLVYQKLQWVGFTSPTVPFCKNTASLCLSQTTWHLQAVHHGGLGLRCRSSSFLHIILSCYLIPAKQLCHQWCHDFTITFNLESQHMKADPLCWRFSTTKHLMNLLSNSYKLDEITSCCRTMTRSTAANPAAVAESADFNPKCGGRSLRELCICESQKTWSHNSSTAPWGFFTSRYCWWKVILQVIESSYFQTLLLADFC